MDDLLGPWEYRATAPGSRQWEISYASAPHTVWGFHPTAKRPDGESVYMSVSGIASEAQIRAMAAAPDLIEGLEGIRDLLEEHITDMGAAVQEGGRLTVRERATLRKINRALAALSKAKGQ